MYLGAVAFQYFRYLLIVGSIFSVFWIFLRTWTEKRKVSEKRFTRADIWREIRASFWFVCAISVPVAFFAMPENRHLTRLYFDLREYPLWWPPLSFLILLVGQDAYFYWTHRMMHSSKWLYQTMHSVHHRSLYPSAFATFAMHPTEALVASGFNFAMALVIPLHFGTFMFYQLVQLLLNIYGHLGADVLPQSWKQRPVLRHLNRTAAHAGHHRYFRVNYGLYFTFWDRWMGTYDDRPAPIDVPRADAKSEVA